MAQALKFTVWTAALCGSLLLFGCAHAVKGPSVVIYPAAGKSPQDFAQEEQTCRSYARQTLSSQDATRSLHKQQFIYDAAYEQCMAASGNPLPPNSFWSAPESKHYLLNIPQQASPYTP